MHDSLGCQGLHAAHAPGLADDDRETAPDEQVGDPKAADAAADDGGIHRQVASVHGDWRFGYGKGQASCADGCTWMQMTCRTPPSSAVAGTGLLDVQA